MRFVSHIHRLFVDLHQLLSVKFNRRSGIEFTQVVDPRTIELYANDCRRVLREGGTSYAKWFFDEDSSPPNFAFLQSFDMSTFKGSVHDYLVYFEVHLDPKSRAGKLSVCTLEVGPTIVRSTASHGSAILDRGAKVIPFETRSKNHHLRGSVAVRWRSTELSPSFRTAEYSLDLIHPSNGESIKTTYIKVPLQVRQQTINCPNCLGEGQVSEWAIPKAAYKSGLSGYALFSENTVSGHSGCTLCGGSGTAYEKWYLREEQIDQASLTSIVKGSGRVTLG